MTPLIQQRVRFPTSPQILFDLYVDSRQHSFSTGAPATVSRKAGGKFKAFGGQLEGKNLLIIPGKQVVQLWRASHWKKEDCSILILTFRRATGGAQIDLVHVGVPAYDHKGVKQGWPRYYWRPWKKYLAASSAKKPQ
jgi:activator of HSP90 ATPase